MITIRRRNYVSENNCDVTFTRLGLDVEEVDTLFPDFLTVDTTVDTNKRWVGEIDRTTNTFDIIKPNPSMLPTRILAGNVFNLYVFGKVTNEEPGTRIRVKFSIGMRAFVGFALIYFMSIGGTIVSVTQNEWYAIPLLLFLPISGTFALMLQLNRTEEGIIDSLGVR